MSASRLTAERGETEWHEAIERLIYAHASRLNGYQVARCVMEATDACWEMGLDKSYHDLVASEGLTDENAEAFHLAWLTIFALKLHGWAPKIAHKADK